MKIIRTSVYKGRVSKIFSDMEIEAAEDMICGDPLAGDVISKTGGVRKIRVSAKGHGKRGGARIIYYFWQGEDTLFLFTAYAKNQQSDLSEKDKKDLLKITTLIQRGKYEH